MTRGFRVLLTKAGTEELDRDKPNRGTEVGVTGAWDFGEEGTGVGASGEGAAEVGAVVTQGGVEDECILRWIGRVVLVEFLWFIVYPL